MTQRWTLTMIAGILVTIAPSGAAQTMPIAQRVGAVRQGNVELHFAARPGVCGDGSERLSIGRDMQAGRMGRDGFGSVCVPGPVRVRLLVEDGVVTDIRTVVGPARSRGAGESVADLGALSASSAAAYFLQLVSTANGRVSDGAVLAAVLADSIYPWRELLGIARDSARLGHATRTNAAFWLSRFAAATLAGHANDLATPDDGAGEERDARSSAVFALSQLRNREGIPPLLQVARTNRDARVRREALFWLGQSGDPRALALFEEILAR